MFDYFKIVEELRLLDEVMYPSITIKFGEIYFEIVVGDYELTIKYSILQEKYEIETKNVDSEYLYKILNIISEGYKDEI